MQSSTVNSALSAVSQSVSGTYVQDVSIKMLDNAIGERFSLKPPFDDLFREGRGLLIGPAEARTGKIDDTETFFHSLNDLAAALEEGAQARIIKIF